MARLYKEAHEGQEAQFTKGNRPALFDRFVDGVAYRHGDAAMNLVEDFLYRCGCRNHDYDIDDYQH